MQPGSRRGRPRLIGLCGPHPLHSELKLEASDGGGSSEEEVDVEALSNNTNGVVFFNGGSYSAGPDFIGGRLQLDGGGAGAAAGAHIASCWPLQRVAAAQHCPPRHGKAKVCHLLLCS